jgi:transposase
MSASKFTPETRGALLERVAAGVSLRDACRAVGLRDGTVKGWLARGRQEGSGPYSEFAEAIDQARQAAKDRPQPMDADELAQVVSEMARNGSVQAAKLRWEMLRASEGGERAPGDILDELEARRRSRA